MSVHAVSRLSLRKGAHEDSIWSLCWVNVGGEPQLLTGGVDETVKSWRVDPAGEGLAAVEEYTGEAVSVLGVVSVVASDTGLAATCSLDSTIRVWDLATNTHIKALESAPAEAWTLAFAPGDAGARLLACAGGATASVALFNIQAQPGSEREATFALPVEVAEADPAGAFVVSVAYSPDGSRLACGTMGGCVAIFDTATAQLLHSLPGLFKAVRSLAWASDGSTLAAACDDGHVHVYEAAGGQLVGDLVGHAGCALAVAVSPDRTTLATGGSDATVRIWDARSGLATQTLSGEHSECVWGVAFSPSGAHLASCSDDKSVALFAVS